MDPSIRVETVKSLQCRIIIYGFLLPLAIQLYIVHIFVELHEALSNVMKIVNN